MTRREILQKAADKFVSDLKDEFDKKNLNDLGGAKDSIKSIVTDDSITIEGLARVLFLQYGRRPGRKPPFFIIRSWVERKLDVPEDKVWIVTKTIVDKIAEEGTSILRDEAKGLQIELILDSVYDDLTKEIVNFETENIISGLLKTWKTN